MAQARQRVQFSAPEQAEVVTEEAPSPGPDEVRVRTQYSAISPGTERLVYEGNVPGTLDADPSIEALQGDTLSYPLSYGYACVGEVEALGEGVERDWKGAPVFAFQPHVSQFVAPTDALLRLPESVDPTDAVMIPSMETAVNLVMDGQPMIGETVLVFGQGVVGLLTTRLLADHPLGTLAAVDPVAARRARSEAAGAQAVASADNLEQVDGYVAASSGDATSAERADLVYELTGQPSVLDTAVQHTGFAGRIVVGSWYGTKTAPIDLGSHFHRSRMHIISSQVSTVDPSHQGRWTKDRRMSVVLDLLPEVAPSHLISDRFAVGEAPSVYEQLADGASMLQPIFAYE
ncbi:zinc-dependent alcohol dehydrogenase [Salinibacter altiplanensis]|uniref:zinc-dependent alcohol dehydrogenase n=1 Tax=Salinibacter altiplanensis TaxID=1803181 RepID=UPI000C9FA182|nr:zinc-binding alcohol dehydrogenase [Salinibacter altiplanensis]